MLCIGSAIVELQFLVKVGIDKIVRFLKKVSDLYKENERTTVWVDVLEFFDFTQFTVTKMYKKRSYFLRYCHNTYWEENDLELNFIFWRAWWSFKLFQTENFDTHDHTLNSVSCSPKVKSSCFWKTLSLWNVGTNNFISETFRILQL